MTTATVMQLTLPTFEDLVPDMPLIERLYQWLLNKYRSYGGAFVGSNREAAEALGCSPGLICEYMQRLEAQERIEREALTKGHRITVVLQGWCEAAVNLVTGDRSPDSADRSPTSYKEERAHARTRALGSIQKEEEDRASAYESEANTPEPPPNPEDDPRFKELRKLNAAPSVAADILHKQQHRPWSITDFLRDLEIARASSKGIGYVFQTWRNGNRLSDTVQTNETGQSGGYATGNRANDRRTDGRSNGPAGNAREDPGPTFQRAWATYHGATGTGRDRIEHYQDTSGNDYHVHVGRGAVLVEEPWTLNTPSNNPDEW